MRILHGVQTIDQSHGGLAVAVAELCAHVEGAEILEAAPGENPVPTSAPRISGTVDLSGVDLIHQHGLWTSAMWALARDARRSGRPFVISPHGMLEPWALNHRRWKKKLGMWLFQKRILQNAIALHATSEMEAGHFRDLGLKNPIAVIPNGVTKGWQEEFRNRPGTEKQKAIFLSRLDEKKGIPLLLGAWSNVQPEHWELEIYGDGPDSEIAKVNQQIEQFKVGDSVSFCGAAFGENKWRALGGAHLFVLPSHSENFGVVVAEAMQAGLPVITTTTTPWERVQKEGCGWWVTPDEHSIQKALETAFSQSADQLSEMGKIGQVVIEQDFQWADIGRRMTRFYEWILHRGERPDFVLD